MGASMMTPIEKQDYGPMRIALSDDNSKVRYRPPDILTLAPSYAAQPNNAKANHTSRPDPPPYQFQRRNKARGMTR
ncbi:hypothetical protein L209DRAFT_750219 [Thermothelomyces heterothallicus CBS 203.75]